MNLPLNFSLRTLQWPPAWRLQFNPSLQGFFKAYVYALLAMMSCNILLFALFGLEPKDRSDRVYSWSFQFMLLVLGPLFETAVLLLSHWVVRKWVKSTWPGLILACVPLALMHEVSHFVQWTTFVMIFTVHMKSWSDVRPLLGGKRAYYWLVVLHSLTNLFVSMLYITGI